MGGATKRHPESAWDLIGQDNHWEVPKRPRINTRTPPLNPLLNPRSSASLNFSLELSLSLRKMNSLFSHVLWPHPASCYHEKKKSHLVFTSFYSLTLVYFLSVSSCAKCVCQIRQAQDSAKPANAHFNDSWTLSQSATSEKPFSEKTENKGNPLNTKATQVKLQDLCCAGVILM